jgi:hypothetical protein
MTIIAILLSSLSLAGGGDPGIAGGGVPGSPTALAGGGVPGKPIALKP